MFADHWHRASSPEPVLKPRGLDAAAAPSPRQSTVCLRLPGSEPVELTVRNKSVCVYSRTFSRKGRPRLQCLEPHPKAALPPPPADVPRRRNPSVTAGRPSAAASLCCHPSRGRGRRPAPTAHAAERAVRAQSGPVRQRPCRRTGDAPGAASVKGALGFAGWCGASGPQLEDAGSAECRLFCAARESHVATCLSAPDGAISTPTRSTAPVPPSTCRPRRPRRRARRRWAGRSSSDPWQMRLRPACTLSQRLIQSPGHWHARDRTLSRHNRSETCWCVWTAASVDERSRAQELQGC